MQSVKNCDLANNIGAHLDCPVCMEQFNTTERLPKGLPCQHNFCLRCMKAYMVERQSNRLPCPICKQDFKKPVQGAKGLPTNLILRDIIEITGTGENSKLRPSNDLFDTSERLLFDLQRSNNPSNRTDFHSQRSREVSWDVKEWVERVVESLGDFVWVLVFVCVIIIGKGAYKFGVVGFLYDLFGFCLYSLYFLGSGIFSFLVSSVCHSITVMCSIIYYLAQLILSFMVFVVMVMILILLSCYSIFDKNDESHHNIDVEDECAEDLSKLSVRKRLKKV